MGRITVKKLIKSLIATAILGMTVSAYGAENVKIKDLTSVRGYRTNSLMGVGLVVGLQATGDSKASLATTKALAQMMTSLGLEPTPELLSTHPADSTRIQQLQARLPRDLPVYQAAPAAYLMLVNYRYCNPTADSILAKDTQKMFLGQMTPQQVADDVANGVSTCTLPKF